MRTLSFQPFRLEVAQGLGEHTEDRGPSRLALGPLPGLTPCLVSPTRQIELLHLFGSDTSSDLLQVFLYPCLFIPTLVSSSQLRLMSFLLILFVIIK